MSRDGPTFKSWASGVMIIRLKPSPICYPAAPSALRKVGLDPDLLLIHPSHVQDSRGESLASRVIPLIPFQAILQTHSVNTPEDIVRFSRWMRTIFSILMHRNGQEDEQKAASFASKARDILRTPAGRRVRSFAIMTPA